MEYSKGSHYKWGWNGKWHNDPIEGGTFQTSVGSCVNGYRSFRNECINAVTLLANQFTKPILVGLSGGSDSQVACLALREAKIPFTPVVLQLLGPLGGLRNGHDIEGAYSFCKRFGLKPQIETLDLRQFYHTTGLALTNEHCLTNPRVVVQLALIERVKDTHAFIMAGGDVAIGKAWPNKFDPTTALITSFGPTPIQQHLIKYNIEGCTKLFMYTPELIASFLDSDIVKGFIAAHESLYYAFYEHNKQLESWQCFNYYVKPLFYQLQWPEIISRKKYTGFEKADDLVNEAGRLMANATKRFDPDRNLRVLTVEELRRHVVHGGGNSKIWTV